MEPFCTIFLMPGILSRFTDFPPVVVMMVAVPAGTAWSVRERCFLPALSFLTVTFTGLGDHSFDGRFASRTGTR